MAKPTQFPDKIYADWELLPYAATMVDPSPDQFKIIATTDLNPPTFMNSSKRFAVYKFAGFVSATNSTTIEEER